MRARWLAILVAATMTTHAMDFAAGEKPFRQLSPDGKWLFEAQWHGGDTSSSGYLCDIKEVTTDRMAFADPKPLENAGLPRRIFVAWSPDSRYIAIDYYFGRVVWDSIVLTLADHQWLDADLPPVGNPVSMIHPEDRKRWTGEGDIDSSFGPWDNLDRITMTDTMRSSLRGDDGKPSRIESTRDRVIQFIGRTGKVIHADDPQY